MNGIQTFFCHINPGGTMEMASRVNLTGGMENGSIVRF